MCQCLVHPRTPSFNFPIKPSDIEEVSSTGDQVENIRTAPVVGQSKPSSWLDGDQKKIDLSKYIKSTMVTKTPGTNDGDDSHNHSLSSGGSSDEMEPVHSRIAAFNSNNSEPRADGGDGIQTKAQIVQQSVHEDPPTEQTKITTRAVVGNNPVAVHGVQTGLANMEIGELKSETVGKKRSISDCYEEDDEPIASTSGTSGVQSTEMPVPQTIGSTGEPRQDEDFGESDGVSK